MDMRTEKRECFRLNLENFPPLEARLKSPDHMPCSTVIKDLSASGFSCGLPQYISIRKTDLVYAAFVLPFEKPETIQANAFLVAVTSRGDSRSRILRFRFSDYLNKNKEELIHRFITQQRFDIIRQANH